MTGEELLKRLDVDGHDTLNSLNKILGNMRIVCAALVKKKYGLHPNSGRNQDIAAAAAIKLMERCGLSHFAYSSETSVFCEIARLCFEAITGEHGVNIARACRDAVQERNAKLAAELSIGTEIAPEN